LGKILPHTIMKQASIIFTLFCTFSIFFQSCSLNIKRGNGNIQTEEIELNNFTKVNIGGNFDVTLIKGDENKILIETDENLFRFINTEVFNQSLNINSVHQLKSTDGTTIEIYYTQIEHIHSTGASNIKHRGILANEKLTLDLSGIGAIDLEVESTSLSINLTGAGVITLYGNTDIQETHISGAGGLRAFGLISSECSVNLSGLGGAEVMATEKLVATITGVGGIVYAGNPKNIEKQITGFGKIKRAKEYIDDENI
jgi:hypothetical protein